MQYVLIEWEHNFIDEPFEIYSELDENRMEVRRVEFYREGITFSYSRSSGKTNGLEDEPFPEDLRELNCNSEEEGQKNARTIPAALFLEIWDKALERPDGFEGMFF